MKKRLLLQLFITLAASIADASVPQEYATLSRVYNQRFTPQVDQSATIGSSGTLDQTFNETEGSIGSINLSAQLDQATARAVLALPNSNFLVAMSVDGFNSNIGMYNSEGTLQESYGSGGIVALGSDSYSVQAMIQDVQGRTLVVGGTGEQSSGWLQRVQADGSGSIVFVEPNDAGPWSNIANIATQSTGNIIAVGANSSNAMIARYFVDGGIDTTFGTNGYVILDGSGQLPTSTSGIFSVVVDSQDRIYIPYLDTDNTVWILRLLVDGTPDASWFRSFYGGMTRVGHATTVGTMTTTTATTAVYHTTSSLSHPSSGTATFSVGSSSPYYTGNLTTTSDHNGLFTIFSGSFITNRVAVPYLNGATPDQIRMALDVHDNLIIAAQVDSFINVTGIVAASGEAAYLDRFTSSVITDDQLNLYALLTTQDNSILIAGADQGTGNLFVIKLYGAASDAPGALDTTFNSTGYNFFQSNESATTGAINNICLSPDGRIYAAGYEVVSAANVPYISRLYNSSYDSQTAQYPQTIEQGIVDFSFGNNATQTYQGVVNPYFGSYRGNLYQQPNTMIEVDYAMQITNTGVGDLLMGMNGYTNTSNVQSMILTWLTQDGLLDTNFAAGAGQLFLENLTTSAEQIFGLTQDGSGNIYVGGYYPSGSFVRKYSYLGTSGWTVGTADWATNNESAIVTGGNIALQTNLRVLLLEQIEVEGAAGRIVAFDQATGNLSDGSAGATSFGDGGSGYINYDSFGLSMGTLLGAVLNDAGDIFVAYQNFNTGYIDVAAIYADGSGLISEFGLNGVVSDLFSPNQQNYWNVFIAKTADEHLIVCSADDNNVYMAKLEGITGQLDLTFNGTGMMQFSLATPNIWTLQGVSDGSFLVFGSSSSDSQIFTVRVTSDGIVDETFNAQGSQPGYEFITMIQDANSIYGTSLVIQSATGNLAITGYQSLTSSDASPLVMRSFGAAGTTAVRNYPISVQYPGTLDLSFNGSGGMNLSQLISTGTANMVFAYPAGNSYEGMLLLGIDNGTTTLIARVQEQTLALDTSFGSAGIYTVSPSLTGINSLSIDANNNILIGGTSAGAGWAQQLTSDAQSYIVFDLPTVFPHNVTQINAIGQQESGRYIVVGSDANTDLLIMAFQNQLVDDNEELALDTTFNPLGVVAPVGTYIVGGAAGALYNLVINNDDTMFVAYQDTITPTTAVFMAKVLANGSGLDQTFGMGGMIVTSILADSGAVIRLAVDNDTNIIVAASYNDSLQVLRYTALGAVDSSWIGSDGAGTPTVITGIGSAGVTLTCLLETATQQTILLGYNTIQTDQANGPLFAVRLNSTGQLDSTWNPYAAGSDVPGVLTYFVADASIMDSAWIGISGNVWVAGTYQGITPNPILIEIVGDTYVQQVVQDPLASPAGTLDYTLSPSGALNLIDQLEMAVGTPRQLSILSDQSMFIASNVNGLTKVIKLNPLLQRDVSGFDRSYRSPHGYVIIDNADTVNDMFVADATGQDGSIYVTGSNASDPSSMWAAQVSADGQTVTTLTAANSLSYGTAIRLGSNGKVLVAGYAPGTTTGIIAAFNADLTALDTSFGNGGYYTTAIDSQIAAMTVDSSGRIYIAYKDDNRTLYVQRILSDGSGLDSSFNAAITSYACNYSQIRLQLDQANNQLVIANYANRNLYVNRVSTVDGSDTSGGPIEIAIESHRLNLSNCFIDTNQNIYVIGWVGSPLYSTIVARVKSTSSTTIALDTIYAADGSTPGIANVVAGPLTRSYTRVNGVNFMIGDGILDQDGRVYVVGQSGESVPYMSRLFGDNYYTEVDQAVEILPTPSGPGSFDDTYGTDGIVTIYAGGASSGQQARAIVPITTGTHILTVITSQDGLASWTVRLLSDGTYDTTYGDGQGIAIAQDTTGTEICQGMIFDGQSNAILFGGNAVAGGYVKNILPSGIMNPTFGTANSGIVYLSQFDIINDVAQLSNGQFVIVGSQAGVGLVGLLSLSGVLITSPSIQSFGTNVTSVSIDALDTIYISYASGSSPIIANVAKMSAAFVQDAAYNTNATAVLSNLNDTISMRSALDVNGQIIVAATGSGTPGSVNLIRLNVDGTVDTSFNSGNFFGIIFDPNSSAPVTSLIPLQNGNYLVSGYQYDAIDADNFDYEFVALISSAGAYDTTFNNTGTTPGLLTFQVASGAQTIRNLWGMSVQYDGQILLAGSEESLESIDTPLTMRLEGYPDVKAIQQYPGYALPIPDPINAKFGIALTTVIPYLVDGGSTAVDSLQRVLVGGRTADDDTLVVARFLPDGTLDPAFNGTGIAQTPELDSYLLDGFFIAVDLADNIYVAGVTTDHAFIVAKFLGSDGTLDPEFNREGFRTSMYGVAKSYNLDTLVSGGYISIDYLGNVIIGGMTSDSKLAVMRFFSDGTINVDFGSSVPGFATVAVPNLRYGGYVVTNPSLIEIDNSIYVGASTTDDTLLIVKLTRNGSLDEVYGDGGIAQTAPITNLVNGGPIGLNDDRKVIIGGFTSDKTFVAARFGIYGLFDPTFNGAGISYSNALSSLNSCTSLCIDSNNNVLLGGTSTAYDGVSMSMVVARMTPLGVIDISLSPTGIVTTGTIANLQTGGFVATDALSNIFTGGFDTTKLVVAGLYSGAQIFINNPQSLPAAVFKIYWYANNPKLFRDYLGAEFYAQIIPDGIVRDVVLSQLNLSLDEYALLSVGQSGINLAACFISNWIGNVSRLQLLLITTYPDSSVAIANFFASFLQRCQQVHDSLQLFNNR